MIGHLNIPDKQRERTFIFTAPKYFAGTNIYVGLQKWVKPTGIDFVYGLLIGGGGGGGGGSSGGAGGGGAPGNLVQFIVPAVVVPDTLWVTVAPGGLGGAGSAAGATAGAVSRIPGGRINYTGLWYESTANYVAAYQAGSSTTFAYAENGNGGGGGAAGAPGLGGTAAGGISFNNGALLGLTDFGVVNTAGFGAGGAGGFSAATTDIAWNSLTGGGGGGGRSGGARIGGAVTITNTGPWIPYQSTFGVAGAIGGGAGGTGASFFQPTLFFSGGAGGGANDAGPGGNGGNGGIGCGGGGGGAGSTVGGRGGDGGPGLVVLVCW